MEVTGSASWHDPNLGLTGQQLQSVAESLGYSSIDDPNMPAIDQLTHDQLVTIGLTTDPAVATAIGSYLASIAEPELDPADETFDASEMMFALAALNKELGEMGIEFSKEGVKIDKQKLQDASDKRMQELKDVCDKLADANKSGLASKIFGWIGTIAAVVGAIAAVVITGGAAAPALAVALIGLTIHIMNETGAMQECMEAMFPDDPKAQMIFQCCLMAVMMIAGIATGVGAARALKSVTDLTKMAQMAATLSQLCTVTGAMASVGGGVSGIINASEQKEVSDMMAESEEFVAWMAKFQAAIEQQTEELQELMDKLQNMAFVIPKDVLDSIRDTFSAVATSDPV